MGFFAGRGVSASTLALCRWPVPGGWPSLRGRSSGATVLLLPFGRPEPGFRLLPVCFPFLRGVGRAAAGWFELAVEACALGTD